MTAILLTQLEAADFLGCSVRTLTLWRSKGSGPVFIKIGGGIRYTVPDLLAFLHKNRVTPTTDEAIPDVVAALGENTSGKT